MEEVWDDVWDEFDENNITDEQSQQILLWIQEAEFRAIFYRVYGMPLSSEEVMRWNETPKMRMKQKIFLQVAHQVEDAQAIKNAVVSGNHSVAAVIAAQYDEGEYAAKVISASLKIMKAGQVNNTENK